MTLRSPAGLLVVLCAISALPVHLGAQVRASERATVSQTVDGTTVTIDYARPRARGRSPIFGNVVHWDEVWTPGANDATTLEVNKGVTIDGHEVPAGKYSMWMIVKEEGWDLWLDPEWDLFHTERPEMNDGQIRFPIWAREGFQTDVLTWSFLRYDSESMTVEMAWGAIHVAMEIEVESSMRRVVADEEAEPYLGGWSMQWSIPIPGQEDPPPGEATVTHWNNGWLVMTSPPPGPGWPDPMEMILMPRAEGVFMPGMLIDGELRESFADLFMEFTFDGSGRPAAFEMRSDEDEVFGRGERSN